MNAQLAKARERAAKIADTADWTPEPAIEGHVVCATCGAGPREERSGIIAVGFGSAGILKNQRGVWDEQEVPHDSEDYLTFDDAEQLASEAPNNDWRVYFYAPLYDAVYQRQGVGKWVLIEKGEGFA